MTDSAILAVLRPWRLALIALADDIDNAGWPFPAPWWKRPPGDFLTEAQKELDAIAAGDVGGVGADHLARLCFAALSALTVRASGR